MKAKDVLYNGMCPIYPLCVFRDKKERCSFEDARRCIQFYAYFIIMLGG